MKIGELTTRDGVRLSDISGPLFLCLKNGVAKATRMVVTWGPSGVDASVGNASDTSRIGDAHSTFKSASERYQGVIEAQQARRDAQTT